MSHSNITMSGFAMYANNEYIKARPMGRRCDGRMGRSKLTVVLAMMGILVAFALAGLEAPSAEAAFGISGFQIGFEAEGGGPVSAAGSHPFAVTTVLHLNAKAGEPEEPDGTLRNLEVTLPPGFAGAPDAVPNCPHARFLEFTNANNNGHTPNCSLDTVVGTAVAEVIAPGYHYALPAYNLDPPPGVAAEIGFYVYNEPVTIDFLVRQSPPFNVIARITNVPQPVKLFGAKLTIWGDPSSPVHDSERGICLIVGGACPSDVTVERPFVTLPRACEGPLVTTYSALSWEGASDAGASPTPLQTSGCSELGFGPTIASAPTASSAETPTGLNFDLNVADPGLTDPSGRADSDIEKAVVTLPAGVTTNSSVASGLGACTSAQLESETLDSAPGTGCPESSKVGTVEVETPLLEDTVLPGSVYVAKQGDNPFNNLLTIYVVIKDPQLGVLIRLPGKVDPDPTTGQLTTTFAQLPQLPFSHFHLHFFEGQRAPLVTPGLCGTYSTQADLYPYAAGVPPVHQTADFQIGAGAGGDGCATSASQLPRTVAFSAGTIDPKAGSYSPFVLRMSRPDGSQQLAAISTTLPGGLLGKLAGVPYCPESGVAQAASRGAEGQGALELADPSCPTASEIGTVTVGAGAGSEPLYVSGRAYLAGPYKGAPLSLEIITPAIAGPFDLGVVAVRTVLQVDPVTTQITAVSDPIPTILHGLPLDVRSIAVDLDRLGFMLNPTSCEPKQIAATAISTLGSITPLGQYFQASQCGALKFAPKLTASTSGKTSKAEGASLTVKVAQKPGEANIHKVTLTLPLVLPARLTTLQKACTEAQFAANPAGCPAGSFIGTAKALTPILGVPLTGPAILVSHGGAAFPDVVFLLQGNERGGTIRIDLDGRTDIKKGVTYSRFETVPDAPITSFETSLPQGPHSVLAATGNLCTSKLAMPTQLVGQNGAQVNQTTKIAVTGCPKTKALTRAQKLALALKACHKKKNGAKRTACQRQARRKYGPLKKKGK